MSFYNRSGDNVVEGDFSILEKLVKNLDKNYYVDIGILKNAKYPDEDITVAQVGAKHELGIGTPKRSFIKMPLEKRQKQIESQVSMRMQGHLEKGDVKAIFKDIGIAGESEIQEAFETGGFGNWLALSPETIEEKRSDTILINKGILKKGVASEVGE